MSKRAKLYDWMRLLLCLAIFPGSVSSQATAGETPSYLTGEELARQIFENVVTITNEDRSGDQGTGVVVGVLGNARYILTAGHLVSSIDEENRPDSATAKSFRVQHCDPGQEASAPYSSDAHVVFNDSRLDVAILQVSSSAPDYPQMRISGADHQIEAGTDVWTIGKGGTCTLGKGQVFEQDGDILLVDLPGGFGGTSGAPVATTRGVIGIVLSLPGAAKVKIRSLSSIRRAVAARADIPWSIQDANNLSPSSREDVMFELSSVLNAYVFAAKDLRDSLLKETYTELNLATRMHAYNQSINRLNEVKDKFDGSIQHDWGTAALEKFRKIRTETMDVHTGIRGINVSMDALRDTRNIPFDIRRKMTLLSPRIDQLDETIQAFIVDLAGTKT